MIYAENILICIAIPLLLTLALTKGREQRFVAAFLAGMCTCLLAAYISGFINQLSGMGNYDTSIFIAPMVEEIMKFLPLFFYFILFEPLDGDLMLFSIASGAGFAIYENCCYILSFGADSFGYMMIRGLAVGVMHLISISALSMGLVLVRRFRLLSAAAVVGVIALSMTFHGLYNLLVSKEGITQSIGYFMPLLCALLIYRPYRAILFAGDDSR